MSETIKWSSLTEEQRNSLIDEKVMGIDPKRRRTGRWVPLDPKPDPAASAFYCVWLPCPPCYTTSMDAAWQIVEKMKEPDAEPGWEGNHSRFADFCEDISDGSDDVLETLWNLTPERICIAGLRAVGVALDTEYREKSEPYTWEVDGVRYSVIPHKYKS